MKWLIKNARGNYFTQYPWTLLDTQWVDEKREAIRFKNEDLARLVCARLKQLGQPARVVRLVQKVDAE